MNKKITVIIILILGLIVFFSYSKNNLYTISNNKESFEKAIYERINENNVSIQKINRIKDTNTYIALFYVQDNLGYAELIQGKNGKFKRGDHLGYGTNLFQKQVITTNKGKYVIVVGKNHNKDISKIVVKVGNIKDGFSENLNVSEKHFIKYFKVSNNTKEGNSHINLHLFNKDNIEITKKYTNNKYD